MFAVNVLNGLIGELMKRMAHKRHFIEEIQEDDDLTPLLFCGLSLNRTKKVESCWEYGNREAGDNRFIVSKMNKQRRSRWPKHKPTRRTSKVV